MKWLLIAAINFYRWLPNLIKRQCVFKETCSSFVARAARESGFWQGMRAFSTRFCECRPGYLVYFDAENKGWRVRFANGSVSNISDVADFVASPYRNFSLQTWTVSDIPYVEPRVLTLSAEDSGDREALPGSGC